MYCYIQIFVFNTVKFVYYFNSLYKYINYIDLSCNHNILYIIKYYIFKYIGSDLISIRIYLIYKRP